MLLIGRRGSQFYKNNKTSNLLDERYWFKEEITYTKISSKAPSFRYLPINCVFDGRTINMFTK